MHSGSIGAQPEIISYVADSHVKSEHTSTDLGLMSQNSRGHRVAGRQTGRRTNEHHTSGILGFAEERCGGKGNTDEGYSGIAMLT
jgi:hypothetical protein